MKSVKQIKSLVGKPVLVRVDFNVPIKDGKVEDDFKIKKALPTIEFLQSKKAKIILISHLGKGGDTLLPVAKVLNDFVKVKFVPQVIGSEVLKAISEMENGDVILLENLRNDRGEKDCSKMFALNLARLGEVYVNEAFSASHREDASIVVLPSVLPAYAGLQLSLEVKNLSKAFKKPEHPFLFILGGAKFSTKMPLVKRYLKLADYVFVGGALANDFFKAKGYEVGESLVDETDYDISKILKNKKLILPVDVLVKDGPTATKLVNKKLDEVDDNDIILDIGKETIENLSLLIKESKLILWNGPLGKYEVDKGGPTKEILKSVASSSAHSIIGGGDTVALISEMNMEHEFSFVSTGGGAMIHFLVEGDLPGIKMLK